MKDEAGEKRAYSGLIGKIVHLVTWTIVPK
jgi:hypothetical protein